MADFRETNADENNQLGLYTRGAFVAERFVRTGDWMHGKLTCWESRHGVLSRHRAVVGDVLVDRGGVFRVERRGDDGGGSFRVIITVLLIYCGILGYLFVFIFLN